LQNYDDLYADVLLWVNEGWIDYCVPQLYWEIGHKAADYDTLIRWWNDHCTRVPLYIGEDVERTVNHPDPQNPKHHQLEAKMRLHQQMPNVKGTVLWYAKAAVDNIGNYGTSLRKVYWNKPALQPLLPWLDHKAPGKVRKLQQIEINGQRVLCWTEPKAKKWGDIADKYVIYCFDKGETINLDDASKIMAVTSQTYYELPALAPGKYVFVVTALDRIQNESSGKKIKVKY
jgi:hypothetical protein